MILSLVLFVSTFTERLEARFLLLFFNTFKDCHHTVIPSLVVLDSKSSSLIISVLMEQTILEEDVPSGENACSDAILIMRTIPAT